MRQLLLLFLFSTFLYAQNDKEIEVVVVKKAPKIATILKKVNKQLLKNVDSTTYTYTLNQLNLENSDTIIYRKENQLIKCVDFAGNFTKKNEVENKDNWFSKVKETFKEYSTSESPIGWISGFPVRKNITIADLDFFKNTRAYTYKVEWLNDEDLQVTFQSYNFYSGKFVVDKDFNLISLAYEVQAPYPFYYTSKETMGKFHAFTSSWIYQREKVDMTFKIIKKKMALESLTIDEKLRDFLFNRYTKEGVVFSKRTNFTTKIELYHRFD